MFVEDGVLIDRKLNVALTRAREQMIIVGEKKLLSHNSVFAELIEYSEKLGCFFVWNDMPEYTYQNQLNFFPRVILFSSERNLNLFRKKI